MSEDDAGMEGRQRFRSQSGCHRQSYFPRSATRHVLPDGLSPLQQPAALVGFKSGAKTRRELIRFGSTQFGARAVKIVAMTQRPGFSDVAAAGGIHLLETLVTVQNSELSVGATRLLFAANPQSLPQGGRTFDLAADGQFVVNTSIQENQTQIAMVSNWDAALKK